MLKMCVSCAAFLATDSPGLIVVNLPPPEGALVDQLICGRQISVGTAVYASDFDIDGDKMASGIDLVLDADNCPIVSAPPAK